MRKLPLIFCVGSWIVAPCVAFADDGSPLYSKADSGETMWTLTDYLHGTTEQVRALLNKDVDRLGTAVAETNHDIDELNKNMGPEQQRVVAKVRASVPYLELVRERNQADADRKNSEGLDKLNASSRFNKARFALKKMEDDAVSQDSALADDQKELADDQKQLVEHKAALVKAAQWRWHLVSAIRDTFVLAEPLDVGTRGLIPSIKVLAVTDEGPLGEFDAIVPDSQKNVKAAEGIETVSVEAERVALLVRGSFPAKVGKDLPLNQTFEVVKARDHPKLGMVYVVKPVKTVVDELLDGMPTQDPGPTTRPSR